MSPEGMQKAARKVNDECPEVLERHFEEPKLFVIRKGERCSEQISDSISI